MAAIVIENIDKNSLKLLAEMAKKLGSKVTTLNAEQTEDLALGLIMQKEKTGKAVSRESVMKKLRS
jgi:hypothetical protein